MIFISAPDANFDGTGSLINLAGATLWPEPRLTFATGTYRVTTANSVSPPFTTGGNNGVLGGTVAGNALQSFLFAPTANFTGDTLTSLTGCLLSKSQNVTGLLGGASYRMMVLAQASDIISVDLSESGEWIVTDTVVEAAPTPGDPTTPVITDAVLYGSAGRYRVVNATQGTDAEYDLIPPTALTAWAAPGEEMTIYRLAFSSEGPVVSFPPDGFTEVETWSAYANGNTFTELDALYERTNAAVTAAVSTQAAGPAGLGVTWGLSSGSAPRMLRKDSIRTQLLTRTPSDVVQVLVKLRFGSVNFRGGVGWGNGTVFTGFSTANFGGTSRQISLMTEADPSGGTSTLLLSGLAVDEIVWGRLEVEGVNLRGKAWIDGSGEPGSWTTRSHSVDLTFDSMGLIGRTGVTSPVCLGYSIGINTAAPSF